MDKSVLHSDRNLIITLLTGEDHDPARVTIQSTKNGPDLSHRDDVVVVFNANALEVELVDRSNAAVTLGAPEDLRGGALQLMIRIDEFFGGWDLALGEDFGDEEE